MFALARIIIINSMSFPFNISQMNGMAPNNLVYFVNLGNGFNSSQIPIVQPVNSAYQPFFNPFLTYPIQLPQNSAYPVSYSFSQPQYYCPSTFTPQNIQNPPNNFSTTLSSEQPLKSITTLPSLSHLDHYDQSYSEPSSKRSQNSQYDQTRCLKPQKRSQKKKITQAQCKIADVKCEENIFKHFFYYFNPKNHKSNKVILQLITRITADFRMKEIETEFHKENILQFFMKILKEFRCLLKKRVDKWTFLMQLCSDSMCFRKYLAEISGYTLKKSSRMGEKMVLTFMQLLKRCFIYYLKTTSINSIQTYNRHLNVGFSRYFKKRRNILNSIQNT